MSPSRLPGLLPGQADRIDPLCDRFELAWIAGDRPRLEDFLARAEEPDRAALLSQLLPLELEYRLHLKEPCTPEEYHQRLPGYALVIRAAFEELVETLAAQGPGGRAGRGRPRGRKAGPNERYEIRGLLGQGGMGAVYQAQDRWLDRTVALKMIRPEAMTPGMRSRFQAEARAVAQLDHPHIIKIFDVGEMTSPDGCGTTPWLALEYVPGGSLGQQLAGPLEPALAARLVALLARAMQHAHERGIIHRDLKPDNVLLADPSDVEALNTPLGCPKITDFGLSRRVEREQPLAKGTLVLGTPGYLAPEQAGGLHPIGPPADVYALGVILYRLLTGKTPFEADSLTVLLDQVRHRRPTPLRQVRSEVPVALESICLGCLDKQPDRRPTAAGLAEQLERFCAGDSPPLVAEGVRPPRAWARQAVVWLTVLAGAAVLLVGPLLWRGLAPRGEGREEKDNGVFEPLQVRWLEARLFSRVGPDEYTPSGVLGMDVFHSLKDDGVKLEAKLSRPGHAYVIAYRPDGTEEVCFPEKDDEAPPLTDRPRYPVKEHAHLYGLNEGTGLQVFVLVASSQPLEAYPVWRARQGQAPWGQYQTPAGVVWQDEGAEVAELTAASAPRRERGKAKPRAGCRELVKLTDWWRTRAGVEVVRGVGFAVSARQ